MQHNICKRKSAISYLWKQYMQKFVWEEKVQIQQQQSWNIILKYIWMKCLFMESNFFSFLFRVICDTLFFLHGHHFKTMLAVKLFKWNVKKLLSAYIFFYPCLLKNYNFFTSVLVLILGRCPQIWDASFMLEIHNTRLSLFYVFHTGNTPLYITDRCFKSICFLRQI